MMVLLMVLFKNKIHKPSIHAGSSPECGSGLGTTTLTIHDPL